MAPREPFLMGFCAHSRVESAALEFDHVRAIFAAAGVLMRGDRVVIREGYNSAGSVGFYEGKSNDEPGKVIVHFGDGAEDLEGVSNSLLAEAIEPKPYTKRERAERAVKAWEGDSDKRVNITHAAYTELVDLLERGV